MTGFEPRDPAWEARIRDSFARQPAMALIGARLGRLAPGDIEVELPIRHEVSQQHGFVHGGVVAMIADSAAGYAAFSLMPADGTLLSVEFKLNFLAPGRGETLVARGRVLRPGRTLTVVEVDVESVDGDGARSPCARMLQTLMALPDRPDAPRRD